MVLYHVPLQRNITIPEAEDNIILQICLVCKQEFSMSAIGAHSKTCKPIEPLVNEPVEAQFPVPAVLEDDSDAIRGIFYFRLPFCLC